jgi:hypothetical protein
MNDIVDAFMSKVRSHPELKTGPWPQRIDGFEKALQALFISDDEHAIEMFDEIRGVMKRKHVTKQVRIAMIRRILRAGSTHLS